MQAIKFVYTNHRHETRERSVIPYVLAWEDNEGIREYGYDPGLFVTGIDTERNVQRSFSVKRMVPVADQKVIVDFRSLHHKDEFASLINAAQALIDSVNHDEFGSAIGRFQDGNGGLISKETHQAAAELKKVLDFYK